MCDVQVVSIDSRGRGIADSQAYKEHTCDLVYFYQKIAKHPRACRVKSEVAASCGLDMTLYFHQEKEEELVKGADENQEEINHAASFLTIDPTTGFVKHGIRSVAYVVLKDGMAPLSWMQIWGMIELISDASSYFSCYDKQRGKEELAKLTYLYRRQSYGPLSIYISRDKATASSRGMQICQDLKDREVSKPKKSARTPFSSLQERESGLQL